MKTVYFSDDAMVRTWDVAGGRDRTVLLEYRGAWLWQPCRCGARMKCRGALRPRCRGCRWRDRQRAKRAAAANTYTVAVDEVGFISRRDYELLLISRTFGVPALFLRGPNDGA